MQPPEELLEMNVTQTWPVVDFYPLSNPPFGITQAATEYTEFPQEEDIPQAFATGMKELACGQEIDLDDALRDPKKKE